MPSPPHSQVSVLATLDFKGQTISIASGDISQGISTLAFQLTNPVVLGPIDGVFDWLNSEFAIPLTTAQVEGYVEEIPTHPGALNDIREALLSFLQAIVTINVLSVNMGTGLFIIGVSAAPQPPVNLLGIAKLTSIGVTVSRFGSTSP